MNDTESTRLQTRAPDTSPMNLKATTAPTAAADGTTTYTVVMVKKGEPNPVTPAGSTQLYPPQGVTIPSDYTLTGEDPNEKPVPRDFKIGPGGILVYSTP